MGKTVQVKNMWSGMVVIKLPEYNFIRKWERKGEIKTIDFDMLKEALYNSGVSKLFTQKKLYIENQKDRIALGIEEPTESATQPEKYNFITEDQIKRYLTILPTNEFKSKIKSLSVAELDAMYEYAIKNKIVNMDKNEIFKEVHHKDIIKSIQLMGE